MCVCVCVCVLQSILYYIINILRLPRVSVTLVAFLTDVS